MVVQYVTITGFCCGHMPGTNQHISMSTLESLKQDQTSMSMLPWIAEACQIDSWLRGADEKALPGHGGHAEGNCRHQVHQASKNPFRFTTRSLDSPVSCFTKVCHSLPCLDHLFARSRPEDSKKLLSIFSQVTRTDVSLGNLVLRAKILTCKNAS